MLTTEDVRGAMLSSDEWRDAVRRLAREHQCRAERITKALLGQWVSGLEPGVAYDDEYRVIGLSYGNSIVLHAEPQP